MPVDDTPQLGTCTASRNVATGERCGSTEIAGFGIHVQPSAVAAVLEGRGHPEIYLQPRCAEHFQRNLESDRRLREEGASPFLVDSGFAGAAVGSLWIVKPAADGDPS